MSQPTDPSSPASQFQNLVRNLNELSAEAPETSEPAVHDPSHELTTLRDFNAKLLERISEIRRRNFELSKLEDKSRTRDAEVAQLREQETKMRLALAKLTDESWAKDLEIRALREGHVEESRNGLSERDLLDQYRIEISTLTSEKEEFSNRYALMQQGFLRQEDEIRLKDSALQDLQSRQAEAARKLQAEVEDEFRRNDQKLATAKVEYDDRIAMIEIERAAEQKAHVGILEDLRNRIKVSETDKLENLAMVESIKQELNHRESKIFALEKQLQEREILLEAARVADEERSVEAESLRTELSEQRLSFEESLESQKLKHELILKEASEAFEKKLRETEEVMTTKLRDLSKDFGGQTVEWRKRESELTLELASVSSQRDSIEKRLNEANEKTFELRTALDQNRNESRIEIRNLKNEAELAISDLQKGLKTQMQAEFREKFEVVLTENARLKNLLQLEDTSIEVERKDLQKRQVQLHILEQRIRESAEILRADKTKVLQISKHLVGELNVTRTPSSPHLQRQNEERSHEIMSIIKTLT